MSKYSNLQKEKFIVNLKKSLLNKGFFTFTLYYVKVYIKKCENQRGVKVKDVSKNSQII